MKTIEKAAKEHASNVFNIWKSSDFTNQAAESFTAGVEFSQHWILVEEELPKHKKWVDFKLSDGSYAIGYSEYYEHGDSCLYIWGKELGLRSRYENWELKNGIYVTHFRPIELK